MYLTSPTQCHKTMRPTAEDYQTASVKVKEQLDRGIKIRNLEAYLDRVAENQAASRAAEERYARDRVKTRAAINEYATCDANGLQWRTGAGTLVKYDDSEGETAFMCKHGPIE